MNNKSFGNPEARQKKSGFNWEAFIGPTTVLPIQYFRVPYSILLLYKVESVRFLGSMNGMTELFCLLQFALLLEYNNINKNNNLHKTKRDIDCFYTVYTHTYTHTHTHTHIHTHTDS